MLLNCGKDLKLLTWLQAIALDDARSLFNAVHCKILQIAEPGQPSKSNRVLPNITPKVLPWRFSMSTLAPLPTLGQQAIAKKIKELVAQLPIDMKLEVEAEITQEISQELVTKKAECGKSTVRWQKYLKEAGLITRDAAKRIKLAKVPQQLWSVGTLMVAQLSTPMYEMIGDRLQGKEITQELVQKEMANIRQEAKAEREAMKAEKEKEQNKYKMPVGLEWQSTELGRFLTALIHEKFGNEIDYFAKTHGIAFGDIDSGFRLWLNSMIPVYKASTEWQEVESLANGMKELEKIQSGELNPDHLFDLQKRYREIEEAMGTAPEEQNRYLAQEREDILRELGMMGCSPVSRSRVA